MQNSSVSSSNTESMISAVNLNDLANISNIIICIFTIITVIVAYNSYIDTKRRRAKEKAVELARVYQTDILSQLFFVNTTLEISGLGKKLKDTFPIDEMDRFDAEELEKLAGSAGNVNKLKVELLKVPIESIITAKIMQTTEPDKLCILLNCLENPKAMKDEEIKAFSNEWAFARINLLNTLEWFAMNFNNGTAYEEDVYQSLHQTFISAVAQLYFFISLSNECSSRKFYTNIISLYTLWKNRSDKQAEEEQKLYENYRKNQSCVTKKPKKLKK